MFYVTHLNKDKTISIKDTISGKVEHYTEQQLKGVTNPILGVFVYDNEIEIHTVQADEISKPLIEIINMIETPQIKTFANLCRRIIPKYFFTVPASMSGKYHPSCNIGDAGLVRHTIFVCKMLKHITEIESTRQMLNLTDIEIDLMLVACMMHDFLKDGWVNNPADYNNHPINAARAIRGMKYFLDYNYLDFIAMCIESHMGEWFEPKPSNKYQWLVHMSDYLASRREITFVYDNTIYKRPNENVVEVIEYGLVKLEKEENKKVQKARQKLLKGYIIKEQEKQKYGVERSQEEIISILGDISERNSYTPKQKKYYNLAISIL